MGFIQKNRHKRQFVEGINQNPKWIQILKDDEVPLVATYSDKKWGSTAIA